MGSVGLHAMKRALFQLELPDLDEIHCRGRREELLDDGAIYVRGRYRTGESNRVSCVVRRNA